METRPDPAGRGALILIVEDHQDSREMYGEWLQHVGFRVVCCATADEGVRSARELRPDAIATELELRCSDGREFCAALKSDEGTAGIPIVVATAWGTDTCIARVQHLGCAAILVKPVLPGTMAETLARALGSPLPHGGHHAAANTCAGNFGPGRCL
jgi:CheY-like chemotaxis protein